MLPSVTETGMPLSPQTGDPMKPWEGGVPEYAGGACPAGGGVSNGCLIAGVDGAGTVTVIVTGVQSQTPEAGEDTAGADELTAGALAVSPEFSAVLVETPTEEEP